MIIRQFPHLPPPNVSVPAPVDCFFKTVGEALALICEPTETYELRMLHTAKGTVSGYFDAEHREEMAKVASDCSGRVEAVYMTLNPCVPDLLARSANHLTSYARHTTEDAEILRRRWLPLDFDPVRPAGISSTDAEHDAAITRAREAHEWVRKSDGSALGILADSGNGAHLLYQVGLENETLSTSFARKFIQRVHDKFSDKVIQVDLKVFNAGRIWKVYGTMTKKGDEVLGRHHRRAQILEVDGGL